MAAGGVSFAAFPPVYASVFSGLYPAMMLLLFALIFRAVAIEFSNHEPVGLFRLSWHLIISAASAVALLMLGLVVGNLLNGLPLDAEGNYRGGVLELPSPLGITVALLNVAMMATHGALYLGLRAEGELAAWARGRASTAWGAYVGLTVAALIAATTARTGLAANFNAHPSLWALPALTFLAVVVIGILNTLGQRRAAFAASVLGVVGMLASAVAAIFPRLVPAAIPAYSLTIAGAASSEPALQAMLIVAPIGVPLVLAYTILLYWTFSGRVTAPEAEEGHSGRPE